MTDASNALTPGDDGAAAAMEWLDSQEAASNNDTATEATPEPVEQVEEAPSTEEVSEEAVAEEAPAEADPEPTDKPKASVFDDLPDDLRSDLEGLAPETIEKLKPNLLMQADYTRKTQELAEQRRALESRSQAADSWEALLGDPELMDLMARAREMQEAEAAESFDYANAEPEEIDKRVDALVERRLERERSAVSEQDTALESWKQDMVEPITEQYTASGLDEDSWQTVMGNLTDQFEAAGLNPTETLTPTNAAMWLAPHIAAVQLTTLKSNQSAALSKSKADATRSARATSPVPSRTAQPKAAEPWKAEKRDATVDELRAKTLKDLEDAGLSLPT